MFASIRAVRSSRPLIRSASPIRSGHLSPAGCISTGRNHSLTLPSPCDRATGAPAETCSEDCCHVGTESVPSALIHPSNFFGGL